MQILCQNLSENIKNYTYMTYSEIHNLAIKSQRNTKKFW